MTLRVGTAGFRNQLVPRFVVSRAADFVVDK